MKISQYETVFFIVTPSARVGSHMLMSYMNEPDEVQLVGELNDCPEQSFEYIIKSLSKEYNIKTKLNKDKTPSHIGINISSVQLVKIGINNLMMLHRNVKFLVLYRESIFNTFISNEIAQKTNKYHSYDNTYSCSEKIVFDVDKYNIFFKRHRRFIYDMCQFIGPKYLKDLLFVSYENICDNPKDILKKINNCMFGFDYNFECESCYNKMHDNHIQYVENVEDIEMVYSPSLERLSLGRRISFVVNNLKPRSRFILNLIDIDTQEIT